MQNTKSAHSTDLIILTQVFNIFSSSQMLRAYQQLMFSGSNDWPCQTVQNGQVLVLLSAKRRQMEQDVRVVQGVRDPYVENISHTETQEDPTFLISVIWGMKLCTLKCQNMLKNNWWNITDYMASTCTKYKRYKLSWANRSKNSNINHNNVPSFGAAVEFILT